MAFREVSKMSSRREFVTLAMKEGANIRELCRRFGVSPSVGYKWIERSKQDGETFEDRSRRPHHSPKRTEDAIEQLVLEVRDAHPVWNARKIRRVLQRTLTAVPAASTIGQIIRSSALSTTLPTTCCRWISKVITRSARAAAFL